MGKETTMTIEVHDLLFLLAVVLYVLSLIPGLNRVPWVVLGHVAVALGLLFAF